MKKIIIPAGYQAVMPYLLLNDAISFLDFAKKVFDAEEKMKVLKEDATLMHGELQIGNSTIMIGQSSDQYPPQPAGLYIHVADADHTYALALAEGAVSIMPPENKDYGRSGGVKDPFGNTWWITENK